MLATGPAQAMEKTNSTKILVVDDEPSVLFTYRLLLEQRGYQVTAVSSAHDAIQRLEREAFDLLLCDLSLEAESSGFDVIDYSRSRNPEQRAAVLTGYATEESMERAEKLHTAVLYKPIDIEQFFSTVTSLLGESDANQVQATGE